jgi:ribosomal protein L12E/L44/L45/RPP1/RPP2
MKEKPAHSAQSSQKAANSSTSNEAQSFFERPGHSSDSSSFFTTTGAQAKLKIGAENDPFEQQADAMADKIVNKENSLEQDKTQTQNTIQKKEEKKDEKTIQKKSAPEKINDKKEEKIQKKSNGEAHSASPSLQSQLNSSKGGGQPLSEPSRQSMESGFGNDFSNVRVHSDSGAAQMNKELGSHAFTHGNDIYFNEGKYNPGTRDGDHLLAHELTHTIQQTGNVQRKPKSSNSKPIAKGKGTEETEGTVSGNVYTHPTDGSIDVESKIITIEDVKVPTFKVGYGPDKAFKLERKGDEERPTDQIQVWEKDALPGDGLKSKLDAKLDAENSPRMTENGQPVYYFRIAKQQTGNAGIVFGTEDMIKKRCARPNWTKAGEYKTFDVDHQREYQLGGEHKTINMWLLESSTNRSSGSTIKNYINQKIEALTTPARKAIPKSKIPESPSDVKKQFDIKVKTGVQDGKGGPKKGSVIAWELDQIKAGEQLSGLKALNKDQIKSQNLAGTPNKIVIYATATGGMRVQIDWDEKNKNKKLKTPIRFGKNLFIEEVNYDHNKPGGNSIRVTAFKENKTLRTSMFYLDMEESPAISWGGIIKKDRSLIADKLKGKLHLRALSPINLDEADISEEGLVGRGKVKTTIPVIDKADIDVIIDGDGARLEKTFDTGEINVPSPFKISNSSLTVSVGTFGARLKGKVNFGIPDIGEGYVDGSMSTGEGFVLNGEFNFDKKVFKQGAQVQVHYSEKKGWTIKGTVNLGPDTMKGVKEGSLTFGYGKGVITIAGRASLTIPGIKEITISSAIEDSGAFIITGTAELGELPGIKSGSLKVILSKKKAEDLKLGAEGKVIPNFPSVPDMSPTLSFYYYDGLFDVRAKVEYKKGRFKGLIELGVTNRTVDEKGQLQGEALETNPIVVFGYGELTVELFKNATGKVGVRLTPDSQVLVNGQFLLHDLMPFGAGYNFTKPIAKFPRVEIPLIGIPGMSISAFIQGGVNFNFNWQPLVLKVLSVSLLETNINEMEKARIEIQGEVGSFAQAELIVFIDAGLKARVLVATLSGSIGGEAGIGVKAEAGGKINAAWDANKGLQFKEASIFLNVAPFAIFRLTGKISVDLDLWVTTVNLYYKKWVLAEKTLDLSGMELNINFPLTFNDDNTPVMPPYEKMNIQQPDLTGQKGKDLMDNTMNGDAKKEEEAKKQEIRSTIRYDLRTKTNEEDFSPSKYKKSMVKKYGKSPELKEFVLTTIDQESLNLEYEKFEVIKNSIRSSEEPLDMKLRKVDFFTDWIFTDIRPEDVQAFKNELVQKDIDKKLAEIAAAQAAALAAAEEAARIAEAKKEEAEAAKEASKKRKKPKALK